LFLCGGLCFSTTPGCCGEEESGKRRGTESPDPCTCACVSVTFSFWVSPLCGDWERAIYSGTDSFCGKRSSISFALKEVFCALGMRLRDQRVLCLGLLEL
jgi:hypothetical protein